MTGRTADSYAREVLARVEIADGCWRWTGYVLPNGYGQIGRNGRPHRLVWEHLVAPIPEGMTLDHECHNADLSCNAGSACLHRRCVNPAHLRVKTRAANVRAGRSPSSLNATKDQCPNGHPYDEANTYLRPGRLGRICRTCRTDGIARFQAENREELAARQRTYRREHRALYRAYGRERHRRLRLGLPTAGLFTEIRELVEASA